MFPSYRNKLIDLLCKSTDWFIYDGSLVLKGLMMFVFLRHLNEVFLRFPVVTLSRSIISFDEEYQRYILVRIFWRKCSHYNHQSFIWFKRSPVCKYSKSINSYSSYIFSDISLSGETVIKEKFLII